MRYHNITKDDMLNGDGLRVVLWVAGCDHHCEECQNPQTWSYLGGIAFCKTDFEELRTELDKDYITGITFSGGDPLSPHNIDSVTEIMSYVHAFYPEKTIWCYTGYTFEELISEIPYTLQYIDVLVDGEYMKDLRDTNLKWRGSSNQRVIDVQQSLLNDKVILHCD